MTRTDWYQRRTIIRALLALNLLVMGIMLFKVLEPLFSSPGVPAQHEEAKLTLPSYDTSAWGDLPVLADGRIKPMETVAIEAVREVTGRAKFEGQPAMAVLLSWLFYKPGQSAASGGVDWDHYPFILCEDRELRATIFGLKQDDPSPAAQEKIHGKRISPAELRESVPFQRLVVAVNKAKQQDEDRFSQKLDPLERKASTVSSRLGAYEQFTLGNATPEFKSSHVRGESAGFMDPVHYVALDKVPNAPWFSIGEIREITSKTLAPMLSAEENANQMWWRFLQKSRVILTPQLYLPDEVKKSLAEFQQAIRTGNTEPFVRELEGILAKRAEEQLPKLVDQAVNREMTRLKVDQMSDEELAKITAQIGQKTTREELKKRMREGLQDQVKKSQQVQNGKVIADLRNRIKAVERPYVAENPKYSQMYMDYLEARYPDMYNLAVKSQPFPAAQAKTVLAAYDAVGQAYRSGNASQFDSASKLFFKTVADVSKEITQRDYPGPNTVDLELSLNRVEPFKWAWITMLASTLLFVAALKTENKAVYTLGFLPFFVSLCFQAFAYYGRISISGRPPVSNMFETVVFVASMSAVFALILECVYRKTIIILAGASVCTLCMMLADQLPYSRGYDIKIEPLTPVLRSNYWLLIHVMTIVASYAAGALAWAIGNISLVLYWFNSDRKDLLKTMANLSYSAIKIAVLLLGVGTLLGGIWAAESWGRFWGWDPKETWALIALVIYLIPLHARYVGWVKDFGMAVSSVVCFAGIVMSWYGVNNILGVGLHSYGMGEGGPWTMFLLGSINLLWVLAVCHKRATREMMAAPAADVATA